MTEEKNEDVFLVGAGFSKEYGIPLVNEWFDQITQFYKNSPSFLNDYNWLSDEEKKSIYTDSPLQEEITKLFTLIAKFDSFIKKDICQTLITLGDLEDKSYQKILLDLIQWIIYLNYLKYFREKKNLRYYEKIMRKDNVVITLNYDNLIEKELPKEAYDLSNSVSTIKGDYFGFPKGNETFAYPLVLKLHGGHAYKKNSEIGLNEESPEFLFIYTDENKQFMKYYVWKEKHGKYGEDISFKKGGVNYSQVIITPLSQEAKKELFLSFSIYFDKIFKIAEEKIKEAKRIFIIGYSFNELDEHINNLLKKVTTKEIYIVNHSRLESTEKYNKLFPKGFNYLQIDARDFVSYYPNNLSKCFEKIISVTK